jgi:chemotaxis protein MotB
MKPEQIARVVGYADTQLLDAKDPYSDANRRITILVLPLGDEPKPSALVRGLSENKPPVIPETQHQGVPEKPRSQAEPARKATAH